MNTNEKSNHVLVEPFKEAIKTAGATRWKLFEAVEDSFDCAPDLICFSHLRWDFVYQRPQHLMSRCAMERRVFFIEEPTFHNDTLAQLDIRLREGGVCVVVPRLPKGLSEHEIYAIQKLLVDELIAECRIRDYVLWYYTPMALPFSSHLNPQAVVYDCMDELSCFKGAPPAIRECEAELLALADVVFTGGQSLYEAKRRQHRNIHPFPSSIDLSHFGQARDISEDPADQAAIPHPRLGFFGVIDERMDTALLDRLAEARPDWQIVMIGPVVKIDPSELPRRPNIHYLGGKNYKELPNYLAGWDVALLPFAINESTRYISPTKTPEYLAAGKPVVSTSIRDVVRPYGEMNLVRIAERHTDFIMAVEDCLKEKEKAGHSEWLVRVDDLLAQNSWDKTWLRMMKEIDKAVSARQSAPRTALSESVRRSAHKAGLGLASTD